MALADALGNLTDFRLPPGQAQGIQGNRHAVLQVRRKLQRFHHHRHRRNRHSAEVNVNRAQTNDKEIKCTGRQTNHLLGP
jgi:hypothetical protein